MRDYRRKSDQKYLILVLFTLIVVGGVLIASILYFLHAEGRLSFHELLITLFLFLTAPVSANFLAKTYLARNVPPENLPDTGSETGWAIYDDAPARKGQG